MRVLEEIQTLSSMSDRILLTLPAGARFRGVATLVLGGVGSRLDLPYERTDDLQLALVSVLDAARDDEVTIEIETSEDGSLAMVVGPVRNGSGEDSGLARVLSQLVDDASHERRDGNEWIVLRLDAPVTPASEDA